MAILPQQPETPSIRRVNRQIAIDDLRHKLMSMTDDQHSMCNVAARQGIFCGGFRRYTDEELRDRYNWLVERNPSATRKEIEAMANLWQISREVIKGVHLACDAQTIEHDTCHGWDQFSNEDLQHFYADILREEVNVV